MIQYYILKPNIVNRDNLVKYTATMQKIAEEQRLVEVVKMMGKYTCSAKSKFFSTNGNLDFYDYFVSHEDWLLPAPEHLVIAARLRGEL